MLELRVIYKPQFRVPAPRGQKRRQYRVLYSWMTSHIGDIVEESSLFPSGKVSETITLDNHFGRTELDLDWGFLKLPARFNRRGPWLAAVSRIAKTSSLLIADGSSTA